MDGRGSPRPRASITPTIDGRPCSRSVSKEQASTNRCGVGSQQRGRAPRPPTSFCSGKTLWVRSQGQKTSWFASRQLGRCGCCWGPDCTTPLYPSLAAWELHQSTLESRYLAQGSRRRKPHVSQRALFLRDPPAISGAPIRSLGRTASTCFVG